MEEARFMVEDIFLIQGRGTVVTGQHLSGMLRVGMTATANGKMLVLKGIEMFRQTLEVVEFSQDSPKNLGLLLENAAKEDFYTGMQLVFN